MKFTPTEYFYLFIYLVIFVILGFIALQQPAEAAPVPATPTTCYDFPITIYGTSGRDVIKGTPGRDVIHGMQGNDKLYGMKGSDVICGDGGNDWIEGGQGNDALYGMRGNDYARGGQGNDEVYAGKGYDQIFGDSMVVDDTGRDFLYATDNDFAEDWVNADETQIPFAEEDECQVRATDSVHCKNTTLIH